MAEMGIPVGQDFCDLSRRWTLEPALARMLVQTDEHLARDFAAGGVRWPGLFVISGYRSPALQAVVNPLVSTSKHSRCPSMAADLRIGNLPASTTPLELWRAVAQVWRGLGGRAGIDFRTPDVNHFELP